MKNIIMGTMIMIIGLLGLTSCSKDSNDTPDVKTFVLVHGAFQGPYAWQFVKADLERRGQNVVVVELPGHGTDVTNPATVNIDVYRDKVIAAINLIPGKVVLVGHSMGGMVVSATAEKIPQKIEKLIFIGAFVPANGQSILQLAATDQSSLFGPALIPSSDQLSLGMKLTDLAPVFCADGSDAVKQLLIANYRSEPSIPFGSVATITAAKFGSVDKYYIYTSKDMAIGLANQQRMAKSAGITKVYTIESSHCPFLSKPDELTTILIDIIKN